MRSYVWKEFKVFKLGSPLEGHLLLSQILWTAQPSSYLVNWSAPFFKLRREFSGPSSWKHLGVGGGSPLYLSSLHSFSCHLDAFHQANSTRGSQKASLLTETTQVVWTAESWGVRDGLVSLYRNEVSKDSSLRSRLREYYTQFQN